MAYELDAGAQSWLGAFFSAIGRALKNKTRMAWFATYAMGLFSSLDRKSVEPIAAAATPDPPQCEPAHHRLLRFLRDSPWSDREVRRVAAQHAIEAMTAEQPIQAWIIDGHRISRARESFGGRSTPVHRVGGQRLPTAK
jgi:SRSO17 transposase